MKILIADQFSELGGAQRVLLELLPALQHAGWECRLAVPGRGPLRAGAEGLGIRCDDIRCGPFGCGSKSLRDMLRFGVQFPPLRAQFRRLADEFHPDLLYVNAPRLIPATCSLGPSSPPILFHAHSYLKPRTVAALTGRFLRRAGASVIGNCNFVLEPLRRYLDPSSAEVIYNGVQDCGFRAREPRDWRIGMIGRICPEKGQKLFIEAARLLHETMTHLRFVICGSAQFADRAAEAYDQEVRKLASGLPVEFTGWRDDIRDILHSLDLLVVPSMPFAEATTRVILEAFSAGVPVLASDLPGIREIVEDGESGFLVPPGDVNELSRHIRELIAQPDLLAQAAVKARARFERLFHIDGFHERIIRRLARSRLQSAGAKALA